MLIKVLLFYIFFIVIISSNDDIDSNDEYLIKYNGYYSTDKRYEIYKGINVDIENRINDYSDFDTIYIKNSSNINSIMNVLNNKNEIEKIYKINKSREHERKLKNINNEDEDKNFSTKKHLDIRQIADLVRADRLWLNGYKGQGINVAIFDTGLTRRRRFFRNIKQVIDFTDENNPSDQVGHGTFVAGIIASSRKRCSGIAPLSNIHVYKVFTSKQISKTSWFLDAFNKAIQNKIHIINLSIGGPDYTDEPFMNKIKELNENGIIIVSAIGNDGPLYGTLNNPADDGNIIGVSSINIDNKISKFSSRGMTTIELPYGYGRLKPDIITYGERVYSTSLKGNCRMLSGTSVAAPVITGSIALLLSSIGENKRKNIGLIKQVLIDGAERIDSETNMFEQGPGKLNIEASFYHLQKSINKITFYPSYIDYLDCPYMWPYCSQPLYHTGLPVIFNLTLLNSFGKNGKIIGEPIFEPIMEENGDVVDVCFEFSRLFDSWINYLAVYVKINKKGESFKGSISIKITINVETDNIVLNSSIFMRFNVIPTPHKSKRILWDQHRNLRYPIGYIPRDDLKQKISPLDWLSDHPHTNYKNLYTFLRNKDYFVEIYGYSLKCDINLNDYSIYMLIDSEEEFYAEEIVKLKNASNNGLSLFIFADWYNQTLINKIQFMDDVDEKLWTPETGGSNIPGLNLLLNEFGYGLSDYIVNGNIYYGNQIIKYNSGSTILAAPKGSFLGFSELSDTAEELITGLKINKKVAILGITQNKNALITVYGDSGCLEDGTCFNLIDELLNANEKLNKNDKNAVFYPEGELAKWLVQSDVFPDLDDVKDLLPKHELSSSFINHSKVVESQDSSGLIYYKNDFKCLSWISAPSVITEKLKLPMNFGYNQNKIGFFDVDRLLGPRLVSNFDLLLDENAKGIQSEDYFTIDLDQLLNVKYYYFLLFCFILFVATLMFKPRIIMQLWNKIGIYFINKMNKKRNTVIV